MLHHEFITSTDSKSLFNQIKSLVGCAQESFRRDLEKRREHLRELLEAEEKVYEDEFVVKMKSRVDENIRQRQESLMALKQKRTVEVQKFVAEKKVQQNMTNCIVIRDELRKKDYRETQLCQLEQIDDRVRATARLRNEDEFWQKVQDRMIDAYDRRQLHEEELKKDLQANQCRILRHQVQDRLETEKADWANALQQRAELDAKTRLEADLKKKDRAKSVERHNDARSSMAKVCEQQRELAKEAADFEDVFHEETMRQVRLEMEEALNKDRCAKEATLDYLNYLAKFKRFEDEQEKMRDGMFEQLAEHIQCAKRQPKVVMATKKRLAAQHSHQVLLKQICEEMSRRAALQALEKENKIIENRFSRVEVRDKVKEHEKIRSGLDLQLREIKRLKDEKEKEFEGDLDRAEEDRVYCEQLLDRHKREGLDYLTPHPNWKLVAGGKSAGTECKERGGGDG